MRAFIRYFIWVPLQLMTVLALLIGEGKAAHADDAKLVLIAANANTALYQQAINGFKTELANRARYTEIFEPTGTSIAQAVNANKPALIFAVGEEASKLAQQQSGGIPVISTLVLSDRIFKASNITGVSLNYPLTTQVQWLRKFLPDQNTVGVLFNSAENADTVQSLKKVVEQAGLKLKAILVETPRQLPDALEQLSSNIEVLLAIPDSIAFSPATVKEVMLASFRGRVPLIGLSENWVKSGALYALSWDYEDLGRQCGAQAQKLFAGQSIKSIEPETPRKVAYAINLKIAEHMNIVIPDSLLQKAKTTFN